MLSSFVDYPPARLVSVSPGLMYVGEPCCLTTATENTARPVSVTALTSTDPPDSFASQNLTQSGVCFTLTVLHLHLLTPKSFQSFAIRYQEDLSDYVIYS